MRGVETPAAVHPEVRIPLEPLPDDNGIPVLIRWTEDGNRLVIRSPVDLGPGAFWHTHGMDLALAVGLVGVLWLALLARRIVKRPQVAGRAYCGKCNYDVGDVAPGKACPECGAGLDGGADRVRGRARTVQAVRAWPWALAAVAMAAMGIGYFASRANGPSMALRTDTWPVAGLDRVSGAWPLWRPLPYRPSIGSRMDVWRVPAAGTPWAAAPEWSIVEDRPGFDQDFTLAPDGTRAAWLRLDHASTPNVLRVAEFATRSTHEVTLSTSQSGSFRMHGWADRSNRLTVTFATLVGVPGVDGTTLVDSVLRARVLSVDCRPGARDPVRTVGDVTWNEPVGPSNVMVHRMLVAAVADPPDGGPASWAMAALAKDAKSIGRLDAVDHCFAGRGGTVTRFGTRACPDGAVDSWGSGFWRDFKPSITADGVFVATTRLSLRLEDGACVPSRAVPILRLEAMQAIDPPHEAMLVALVTNSEGVERAEVRGRLGGFGPLVAGLESKAEALAIRRWPHGFYDRPSTSRDGRLVAMAFAPPPPITAPGVPPRYDQAGTRYEVWVWRLPGAPRK
jgi:hypothetical protein